MREGHGMIQTWRRMKQLLRGIFFISYPNQRCTHGSKRVNEYTAQFCRLTKRNQLPESEK